MHNNVIFYRSEKYQKVTDVLEELDSTKEQLFTKIEKVQYLFSEVEENISKQIIFVFFLFFTW